MKRLKRKLLAMEPNTTTYREMYNGSMSVIDPSYPDMPPMPAYDPIYYAGEIGYHITATHKLAQDRPTVTVNIPAPLLLPADHPALPSGAARYGPAAADFCLRAFLPYLNACNAALYNRARPDEENGKYYLCSPGGEILVRNSAYFALCPQRDYEWGTGDTVYVIHDGRERPAVMCLCLRLQVQLPRRQLRRAVRMLCRDLPDAVDTFLAQFDLTDFCQSVALAERQAAIRAWLKESDYCAFLANGSILPREKGSDLPLCGAVPFVSPPEDEIEVCGVRGMGVRRGVTVITGGGYSGKSTLLDAISAGIYDHVAGDGRELCITDESAVTVSAEDGRCVRRVNISPFIRWLPGGDTADFSTDHASGSTSQAANIMEAVDGGAGLLLIDEDRSATNFMIRDRMMKTLIEREPIIPFTDRVGELYRARGTSTILVIGGSGEYLAVADRVWRMDEYRIADVTAQAKAICRDTRVGSSLEALPSPADWTQSRRLCAEGFTSYPAGRGSELLAISDMGFILMGDERVDVRGLHDIVSPRQLTALGFILRHLAVTNRDAVIDLDARVDALYARVEAEGPDFLYSPYFTTCDRFLDLPRKQELYALIHRLRGVRYLR